MFDPSKPIQTRDGKKAILFSSEDDSLIAFVEKGQHHPSSGGLYALRVYNTNGKYFGSTGADSCVDLINAPSEKTKKEEGEVMPKTVKNPMVFDPSLPLQTRDGRKAKIYEMRPDGTIAAFIQKHLHSEEWAFKIFYENGRSYSSQRLQELACPDDLINVPPKKKKKEGWVNIYPCLTYTALSPNLIARQSGVFDSRLSAEKWAKGYYNAPKAAATIKIEWEEEE